MLDLSQSAITKWYEKLPEDVRAAIGEPKQLASDTQKAVDSFARSLSDNGSIGAGSVVASHRSVVDDMGAPRRLRLMSWVSATLSRDDRGSVLRKMADEAPVLDVDARSLAAASYSRSFERTFSPGILQIVARTGLEASARAEYGDEEEPDITEKPDSEATPAGDRKASPGGDEEIAQ